jgi:hypothetical protein
MRSNISIKASKESIAKIKLYGKMLLDDTGG